MEVSFVIKTFSFNPYFIKIESAVLTHINETSPFNSYHYANARFINTENKIIK